MYYGLKIQQTHKTWLYTRTIERRNFNFVELQTSSIIGIICFTGNAKGSISMTVTLE